MTPSRTRFEALHRKLRERICLLVYPPGTRLAEQSLAKEFGVSRTPIRRVLAWLEAEGLVRSRHGHGTVITNPDMATLRQTYDLRMRLAELLGELDPLLPDALAMERMSALRLRVDQIARAADAQAFSRVNMAFHQELMRMVGNAALRDACERLYYQTSRLVLQNISRVDLGEEIDIFRTEVDETIKAMRRGDMRAVGFIRRNHIAMSFDRLTRGRGNPGLDARHVV